MECGEKRPAKDDIQIFVLIGQKRMLAQLGKTLGEAVFGEMVQRDQELSSGQINLEMLIKRPSSNNKSGV